MNLETRIKLSDQDGFNGTPFRYWINRNIVGLIDQYCPPKNARVLDLGCGQGQYAKVLRSAGIKGSYLGIDLEARDNWNEMSRGDELTIEFRTYDAEKIGEIGRQFNFIYAITSFEHFEDDVAALNGMYPILDEGKCGLIIVPSHYSYLNYATHGFRRYSSGRLRSMAENAGFSGIEVSKIGGLGSFLFHLLWKWSSQLIKWMLKLIVLIPFPGNKKKARERAPQLHYYLDGIMHLHLMTASGKWIHKTMLRIGVIVDRLLPICEVGYVLVFRK